MKGFVTILEAILASVIILTSLTFFFKIDSIHSEWSNVFMQLQSGDSISALYRSGNLTKFVINNDIDGINSEIRKMSPESSDFSIEVLGMVNPIIYIGCNCTPQEIATVISLLEPLDFSYRNRRTGIRVAYASVDTIDPRTNVLFFYTYKDLSPYKTQINKFLENDGTVFILADLTESQTNNGVIKDIFGLNWSTELGQPNKGVFYGAYSDANKYIPTPFNSSYKITNYFINLSGTPIDKISEIEFIKFNNKMGADDANKIDVNDKTVIIDNNKKFSLVKVNYYITKYGKGRAVWFADYEHTDTNTNNLLKAAVMWASGERYKMDPYTKKPAPVYSTIKYFVAGENIFEPFEINLVLWKIFY